MAGGDFVHLHVHSQYSLLDGAGRVEQLVEAAADRGMKALSITDHGVMYGVIDFYKAAKARGIKPIIGAEVYLARRTRHDRQPQVDDSPYHLVLLAENQTGYKNLMELVTRSFLEGFYYKPRVDMELLKQYSSGLIALSGCVAGEIPELILEGRYEQAKEAARRYRRIFGPNNFFLELQDHGLNEQKRVNPLLVQLARELNIPLVATNDVHYVRRQDARIHDVLLCIQTGKTLEDTDRLRFSTEEFYLKSAGEMYQIFEKYPEALANTLAIAERCQVELEFGQLHLPDYQVPPGYDLDSYLKELCYRGLKERFGEPPQEAKERLDYELKIIRQMGYSGYFLIVWDLVN
ncbi:PHP domain-containing protein, partial [Calderihabitans maritimus]